MADLSHLTARVDADTNGSWILASLVVEGLLGITAAEANEWIDRYGNPLTSLDACRAWLLAILRAVMAKEAG